MNSNAVVYILTRTSRRPVLFRHLRESIKRLTWPNIVHIVHSDDPRDDYVEGDIVVYGESMKDYPTGKERGQYNHYNNRLIAAVPGPGWVHFMDDDDEYHDKDCFEKLLNANSDPEKIAIGRVHRGRNVIIPSKWKGQNSFQTECFLVHSSIADSARWPVVTGGDHYYTKYLCRDRELVWVENVLIATSRLGKGHGNRIDLNNKEKETCALDDDALVFCKPRVQGTWQGKRMPLKEALRIEHKENGIITFKGVRAEYVHCAKPAKEPNFDIKPTMKVSPVRPRHEARLVRLRERMVLRAAQNKKAQAT